MSNVIPSVTPIDRIVRMKELVHSTGLSRSSIYFFVKSGLIKAPFHIGARAVGWLESDVVEFIASRVAASRLQIEGGAA